jgi:hypothetical protein
MQITTVVRRAWDVLQHDYGFFTYVNWRRHNLCGGYFLTS